LSWVIWDFLSSSSPVFYVAWAQDMRPRYDQPCSYAWYLTRAVRRRAADQDLGRIGFVHYASWPLRRSEQTKWGQLCVARRRATSA
jgi:hypothetical protein